MKKLFTIAFVFALMVPAFAQGGPSTVPSYFTQTVVGGRAIASSYGQWTVFNQFATAAGAATMSLSNCFVQQGANSVQQFPFATNVPVIVVDGVNTETVTPTTVTAPAVNSQGGPNAFACSITATFSNAHASGAKIVSADDGAMEAANAIKGTGGVVVLDPSFPTGIAATGFAGGFTNVAFEDLRSGAPILYTWTGSAYIASNAFSAGLGAVTSCGTVAANGACANTAPTKAAHTIVGIATLTGSTSTITGLSPAFTSSSTYYCVANDITTRANPVQAVPASGTTVTFTNTTGATDNISFQCTGY